MKDNGLLASEILNKLYELSDNNPGLVVKLSKIISELEELFKSQKLLVNYSSNTKYLVVFIDEDGRNEIPFDNLKEAQKYYDHLVNESRYEKIEDIEIIDTTKIGKFSKLLNKFSKESEALKKHRVQYGPKSELDDRQLVERNKLIEADMIKRHQIEETVAKLNRT